MRYAPLVVHALFITLAIPLRAQNPAPSGDTPEQAVSRIVESMVSDGLQGISVHMHPDALREFGELLKPALRALLEQGEADNPLLKPFLDPDVPARLRELTDAEFMDTFVAAAVEESPAFAQVFGAMECTVLGHVREGEVFHVVARVGTQLQQMRVRKMTVISVKSFNGRYLMLLTGELRGLAEALRVEYSN